MAIERALELVDYYVRSHCDAKSYQSILNELLALSKTAQSDIKEPDGETGSYEGVQNALSTLNEKESIRKSRGVYYTPNDVVRFIVSNSVKSSYGKLKPENINCEDLEGVPYKAFATKRSVFDPTCGAGEYLLAVLEMKLDLLEQHHIRVTDKMIADTIATIYGNDINEESVTIAKMRLFLCIYKRYGAKGCHGLSTILNNNFFSYDYVLNPGKNKYDIIIGNPPYVEDFKSGLDLSNDNKYGNIYANVLINAAGQLSENGSIGFIIPLSYVSTPRMKELREKLISELPEQFVLSYADRPDCLFDSVHQKLCILIGKRKKKCAYIYTGNYQYWYKEERDKLFSRTEVVRNGFRTDKFIPKLGTRLDISIYKKIILPERMLSVYEASRDGEESVYLNRRETFWMKAYREKVDDPEYKVFSFHTKEQADYCYCLINSSLFWWYWISTSDCWHVSKELNGFRAPFDRDFSKATELARALQQRLEETKVYVGTKQTEYEYKHRDCIPEIHQIDDYVNELYDLSEAESQYIKNFAFRYRTSGGSDICEGN